MSTRLGLFYTSRLGNCVHCTFIFKFLCRVFFFFCTLIKRFIWLKDGTLTDITPLGQSKPGSNGNEAVFYISQIFRTGASLSDAV